MYCRLSSACLFLAQIPVSAGMPFSFIIADRSSFKAKLKLYFLREIFSDHPRTHCSFLVSDALVCNPGYLLTKTPCTETLSSFVFPHLHPRLSAIAPVLSETVLNRAATGRQREGWFPEQVEHNPEGTLGAATPFSLQSLAHLLPSSGDLLLGETTSHPLGFSSDIWGVTS